MGVSVHASSVAACNFPSSFALVSVHVSLVFVTRCIKECSGLVSLSEHRCMFQWVSSVAAWKWLFQSCWVQSGLCEGKGRFEIKCSSVSFYGHVRVSSRLVYRLKTFSGRLCSLLSLHQLFGAEPFRAVGYLISRGAVHAPVHPPQLATRVNLGGKL